MSWVRAQAAVVGLSARFDVVERLEKRVRSRFSHRRDQLLELDAAKSGAEESPAALLAAMLHLPEQARARVPPRGPCVLCMWPCLQACDTSHQACLQCEN